MSGELNRTLTNAEIEIILKWFFLVYGGYATPTDEELELAKKLKESKH